MAQQYENREMIFFILVLCTFIIAEITFFFTFSETGIVLTHMFYFFVISAAFFWPEKGILTSIGLGLVYFMASYLLLFTNQMAFVTTTMQFYVFVSIGAVISCLSKRLHLSEGKYRSIFKNSGSAVSLICLNNGEIIEANDDFLRIVNKLGKKREDAIWSILGIKEKGTLIEQLSSESSLSGFETQVESESGEKHTLILSGGRAMENLAVLVMTEITEMKRIQENLTIRNQELATINELISMAGSSQTVEECLGDALKHVLDLSGSEFGLVYLLEADKKTGHLVNLLGPEGDWETDFREANSRINIQKEPYRELFATPEPKYLDNPDPVKASASGSSVLSFGIRYGLSSFMAMPLESENGPLGMMFIASRYTMRLRDEDRVVLSSIGRELGNALYIKILQREVETANVEANLYLDILTHDVNNANTAALGYAEIIHDETDGHIRQLVEKLKLSVEQSRKILHHVSTIRKIREARSSLKSVNLDAVIREEISHFPECSIAYNPEERFVIADDLLSEVFTNLIGNSVKFGGDDVKISVDVEERGDDYLISVKDTGPGIPDEAKARLFTRFQPGNNRLSGKGLGLSICRMLIERYGGTIKAGDRIPGKPEEGTAIIFSLKKV